MSVDDVAAHLTELIPCDHQKAFRKTITCNDGIVFVCEVCAHHWYRTYAQINTACETDGESK